MHAPKSKLFDPFMAAANRRTLSFIKAVAVATVLSPAPTYSVPIALSTIGDLQSVANNLAGDYILSQSIDASVTSTWNNGAGFIPIGSSGSPFIGTFDGRGYSITNLSIASSSPSVGLFGYNTGALHDVSLGNVTVTGTARNQSIGAAVGYNSGRVDSVTVSGAVRALGEFSHAGGVVGTNATGGQITRANGQASVAGNTTAVISCCSDYGVGGVVGDNRGIVNLSVAGGSVQGGSFNATGGLVGVNRSGGSVTESFSTSAVQGQVTVAGAGGGYVGGLIGLNRGGSVDQTYAAGTVTSPGYAGGLVGLADVGGSITQSYATGRVSASIEAAGAIGWVGYGGVHTSSLYWDTQSTGQSTSAAGSGLTTAQLQSGILPPRFSTGSWTATVGRYPDLTNLRLSAPQGTPVAPSINNNIVTLSSAWNGYRLNSGNNLAFGGGGLEIYRAPSQGSGRTFLPIGDLTITAPGYQVDGFHPEHET